MSQVTRLLDAAGAGDAQASADLLPLVYDELRKLAAARMASEVSAQTLQPTALVHEAYLRLVGPADAARWENRGHFFAAAAEAMRRILVEKARRRARIKHGGGNQSVPLQDDLVGDHSSAEEVVAVSEALDSLAKADAQAAELVKLHYFAGLSIEEAAAVLGISPRKGYTVWAYARTWLYRALGGEALPEK
jgi:RNA polymerase sigma factor (TIGR02999 family)